jgi:hypothetical protein
MANSVQPKLVEWNLRKFPEDVKIECQSRTKKERFMSEPQQVAYYIRMALGMTQPDDSEEHVVLKFKK